MAYLNPPLTIIDSQSNLSIISVPPAATWFDEDRQHFVALTGLPSKGTRMSVLRMEMIDDTVWMSQVGCDAF